MKVSQCHETNLIVSAEGCACLFLSMGLKFVLLSVTAARFCKETLEFQSFAIVKTSITSQLAMRVKVISISYT